MITTIEVERTNKKELHESERKRRRAENAYRERKNCVCACMFSACTFFSSSSFSIEYFPLFFLYLISLRFSFYYIFHFASLVRAYFSLFNSHSVSFFSQAGSFSLCQFLGFNHSVVSFHSFFRPVFFLNSIFFSLFYRFNIFVFQTVA